MISNSKSNKPTKTSSLDGYPPGNQHVRYLKMMEYISSMEHILSKTNLCFSECVSMCVCVCVWFFVLVFNDDSFYDSQIHFIIPQLVPTFLHICHFRFLKVSSVFPAANAYTF